MRYLGRQRFGSWAHTSIRQFRDRHSSVMEVILVLTHRGTHRIWDLLCIFALIYLLRILYVSDISILQNLMVDKLMIEDNDSVCEI